jgi:hypothetical protein
MSAGAAALGAVIPPRIPPRPKKPAPHISRVEHAMTKENRENLLRKGQNVAYMFENNENVEPVHVEPLKFESEAPRSVVAAGLKTPNRSTRVPWGKVGSLPSNAPPRRGNRSRKNRKNRSNRSNRSRRSRH